MADSAASISPLNAAAAVTLRSAYQRAAASASWSASSRYSSSRVTAGCRVDATTRLRPWNRRGGTGVDSIEPGANLSRPGGLSVGVYFAFETLNQLTSKGGSLFVRKSKRFDQELLSVHAKTLARHGLRSIRPRYMITRVSTRPGDPRERRDEPECTRQRTRATTRVTGTILNVTGSRAVMPNKKSLLSTAAAAQTDVRGRRSLQPAHHHRRRDLSWQVSEESIEACDDRRD